MNRPKDQQKAVRHTFRPRTGLFACGLWAVVALVWLFYAARDGFGVFLVQLPLVVFSSTLVWATCGRPIVIVSDTDVLLKNVFNDIRIPWAALAEISTKYSLTLLTKDGKKFNAWAAPASGRFGAAKVTQADLRTLRWDESDGPLPSSSTLRSDSGAAAAIVRVNWTRANELAEANAAAGLQPDDVRSAERRWDVVILALLAVSAAASAIALATGGL